MPDETESPYEFAPERPAAPRADITGEADSGGAYDTVEPAGRPATKPITAGAVEPVPERICPHCGFRIVGKVKRARCPDCAAPLDAVATDLLQFSSTLWLRMLCLGLLLLVGAVGCFVATVILTWNERIRPGQITGLAAAGALLLGVCLVTLRDSTSEQAAPLRWPARLLAVLTAAAWAMEAIKPTNGPMYTGLLLTAGLVMCVGFHLRGLAVRIPNDSLASQAQNLSWVVAAMCLFLVALHLAGVADRDHLFLFFFALPLIGALLAIMAWAALFCLLLMFQLMAAATAAHAIAYRKATRQQPKAVTAAAAASTRQ